MVAIVYPSTLPGLSGWGGTPFERRAISPLPGNTQLRGRWRDALQEIDARWFFNATEMAIWVAWYEQTLLNGMLWFAATVPGAGGFVSRVLKYRTSTVKRTLLGNGVFEVTARLQQRGISAVPRLVTTWGAHTAGFVLSADLLSASETNDDDDQNIITTVGIGSGKRVWAIRFTAAAGTIWARVGIRRSDTPIDANTNSGFTLAINYDNTRSYGVSSAAGGTSLGFAHNDIVMMAFDADAHKVYAGINGGWSAGDPSTGIGNAFSGVESGLWYPYASVNNDNKDHTVELLTGDDWPYALPTGYTPI